MTPEDEQLPFTPTPYVAEESDKIAHAETTLRSGHMMPDQLHPPTPTKPFVVGGGSRMHGLIMLVIGLLILGSIGITVISSGAGAQDSAGMLFTGMLKWPILLGAILTVVGLGMVITGGEK